MKAEQKSELFVYTAQHSIRSNRAVFTVQEIEVTDCGDKYTFAPKYNISPVTGGNEMPKKELPYFSSCGQDGNSFLYYVSERRDDNAARKKIELEVEEAQKHLKKEYQQAKVRYDSAKVVFPPILNALQKNPQDMSKERN